MKNKQQDEQKENSASENNKTKGKLQENLDYYWEKGFMVFTKEYHLKRGYCCDSSCRHCPYKGKQDESNLPGT